MVDDRLPKTIWWEDDRVRLIDQSRLPLVGDIIECAGHEGVCWAIRGMAVRGAPALGVAAAMAIALFAKNESEHIDEMDDFMEALANVADDVTATRPTAVNLFWGAERMVQLALKNRDELSIEELREKLVEEALAIAEEDAERNRKIGEHGAELLGDEPQILTHCNAGSLATSHYGTALGVVFAAHEAGKSPRVWVDETRPVMQGSRLTMWELMMMGVPAKLIADNMAAVVMKAGAVDAVIVGADRIAANGDTANKIGTYGLAVLAKHHGIPFYVAAPTSSVDMSLPDGEQIPIEERDERELTGLTFSAVLLSPDDSAKETLDSLTEEGPYAFEFERGHELVVSPKEEGFQFDGWFRTVPIDADVFNPAFDVTPAEFVTAIITENGVAYPPFDESLAKVCEGSGALHEISDAV